MFQQANHIITFAVDSLAFGSGGHTASTASHDLKADPVELRELWSIHLMHEQEEFNKVEGQRHPLLLDFAGRKVPGYKGENWA
jgi:hypothetical protein